MVLASLVLAAGAVVTANCLISHLWDESPPPGALATLRSYVMRLRQTLGTTANSGPILTRATGYSIDLTGHRVDLCDFDTLMDDARFALAEGDVHHASARLTAALALWRGDPLSNAPSQVLHRQSVPKLIEQRLAALELRLETDLALGRHREVVAELSELTARHPLREGFWVQRMLALYRAGRQADALDCYRTVAGLLADELGIDPGDGVRRLYQAILTNDPALTAPAEDPPTPVRAIPGDPGEGGVPGERQRPGVAQLTDDPAAQQLRAFLALAEELHVDRAAARLSMSRSALRVQLHALETRLGISLVDPAVQPVTLTPAGRALLPDVHEAVHAMRRLDSLAALHDPAVDGPLAVGALAAPATPTSPVRGVIGLSANCHGG
ncbi:MAG: BTAD domain-containing putative transcriptional regulator [Pseudonocardiaceae bacterium]